jgi:hypothetical protein
MGVEPSQIRAVSASTQTKCKFFETDILISIVLNELQFVDMISPLQSWSGPFRCISAVCVRNMCLDTIETVSFPLLLCVPSGPGHISVAVLFCKVTDSNPTDWRVFSGCWNAYRLNICRCTGCYNGLFWSFSCPF